MAPRYAGPLSTDEMAGSTPDAQGRGGARPSDEDEAAERLVAFLRAAGAAGRGHAGGRTLLDHLVGTYQITRRWNQPVWLQHAALIHSIYGTEAYRNPMVSRSRRAELARVAGTRAERIAYLFCVTPRKPLVAGTYRWASSSAASIEEAIRDAKPPERGELDALLLLHMANLAEQARADDGSPGVWLAELREVAELLIES